MTFFDKLAEGWEEKRLEPGQPNYRKLSVRMKTFEDTLYDDWEVSPIDLAVAGFYCIKEDDKVKCFCCGRILENWQENDSALGEHFRWSPSCAFVKKEIVRLIESNKTDIAGITKLLNIPEEVLKETPREDENLLQYFTKLQSKSQSEEHLENGCKICLCEPVNMVFIPCRHMACCEYCSDRIGKCCICNSSIEAAIKVYVA